MGHNENPSAGRALLSGTLLPSLKEAVLALALSIACLFLNAFFVAAEFALVKVRVTQLDRAVRRGDRRALAAKTVLSRLDRYLSVTQFGITVASLGLGWIGEPAIERFGDWVALRFTGEELGRTGHIAVDVAGLGLLTFLHLLLGELVPKFIAIQYAAKTVLFTSLPLRIVNTVFHPVLWILEHAQNAVLRLIRIDPKIASEGALSEEEIIGILAAMAAHDPRVRDKGTIIERVLRFASRPVRLAMVPRVDVVWLAADATGADAYTLFRKHEYSRILLVGRSLDDVVGYLYVKDLSLDAEGRQRKTLRGLERHVLFVPESREGLSVLRDMQRESTPFAVVVDEYGGTSGIVTMEDLVEEVFGDIRDELDAERPSVVAREAQVWEVDARVTADDLRDAGVPFDESVAGESIGKIVVEALGRLPRVGDAVRLANDVVAEVVATGKRRIQRVRLRVDPEPAAAT
jgi:CBS domain containing-hemolysin-like protein